MGVGVSLLWLNLATAAIFGGMMFKAPVIFPAGAYPIRYVWHYGGAKPLLVDGPTGECPTTAHELWCGCCTNHA